MLPTPTLDELLLRYGRVSAEIRETELKLARQQREREDLRLAIRATAGTPTIAGVPASVLMPTHEDPTTAERQAVEAIRLHGTVVGRTWLASKLGITVDAANTRLTRAYAKGLLERV